LNLPKGFSNTGWKWDSFCFIDCLNKQWTVSENGNWFGQIIFWKLETDVLKPCLKTDTKRMFLHWLVYTNFLKSSCHVYYFVVIVDWDRCCGCHRRKRSSWHHWQCHSQREKTKSGIKFAHFDITSKKNIVRNKWLMGSI